MPLRVQLQHGVDRDQPLRRPVEVFLVGGDHYVEVLGISHVAVEHHRQGAGHYILDSVFVQTAEQPPQAHQRLSHRTRLADRAQAASRERRSNSSIRCSTVISFSRRIISSRDSSVAGSGGGSWGALVLLGLVSCINRILPVAAAAWREPRTDHGRCSSARRPVGGAPWPVAPSFSSCRLLSGLDVVCVSPSPAAGQPVTRGPGPASPRLLATRRPRRR